jgi:hypothetical protein
MGALDGRQIGLLAIVDPGFKALGGATHPLAGVHRQVTDQLEDRQRRQGDDGAQVTGQAATGQAGLAIDEHAATAADAGAAHEVELQGGVQGFPDSR